MSERRQEEEEEETERSFVFRFSVFPFVRMTKRPICPGINCRSSNPNRTTMADAHKVIVSTVVVDSDNNINDDCSSTSTN